MNVVHFSRVNSSVARILFRSAIGFVLLPITLSAVTLTFPIDTHTSTVKLSLDVLSKTDIQNGKLAGSVTVDVDPLPLPTRVAIQDFTIELAVPIDFSLAFGFLGSGSAHVEKLTLKRHNPPEVPTYSPLTEGQFTAANVSYSTFGDGNYKVTGGVCALVKAGGRPCTDNVDFDNSPPQIIDTITGSLTFGSAKATLEIHYLFSQPLDPTNPDFATVTGDATVTAVAPILAIEPHPMTAIASETGVRLRWPKGLVDLQLFAASDLAPPVNWVAVQGTPVLNGNFYELDLPGTRDQRFFRLK